MAELRLGSLERLRSKLALLEAQAGALDDWEASSGAFAGGGDGLIKAARAAACSPRPRAASPPSPGAAAAAAAAAAVSELKAHLEAVLRADRAGGGGALADITQQHCIAAAVRVICDAEDGALSRCKAGRSALDLAASTLCALSQRPSAHELLLSGRAVPALTSLLSPGGPHSTCAVTNAASALGNLSADAAARRAMRGQGAVGALTRLLRPDAPSALQAAAASALCLLAARDPVVQDSVRYLGGVDHLVGLLASPKDAVAEVARYCLAALQHGNARNAADILGAVRASPALARDFSRLRDALDVLQRPAGGRGFAGGGGAREEAEWEERARLRRAIEEEAEEEDRRDRAEARAARANARAASAAALEADFALASAGVARAAARAASAGRARPDSACAAASAAAAAASAAASAAAAAVSAAAAGERARAAAGGCGVAELCGMLCERSRAARSPLGKHLIMFTSEEVCALLSELGWEPCDLAGIRRAGTTGAELLLLASAAATSDPACSALAARLRAPPHKARRGLRRLRDAAGLFDAIAVRAAQPRLSEVQLRLWLAGSGASPSEAERIVKLVWTLVAAGGGGGGARAVTFWEWAAGFQWVTHALEIYGIDWRRAL
ncbi:MAG: hypothetical protein J3K34DRAFT_520909 [Monoraphidium minutum]|nr:MAG: hypothetical protein J3K34DRAFT_520909 [Monoraphidium minutum]